MRAASPPGRRAFGFMTSATAATLVAGLSALWLLVPATAHATPGVPSGSASSSGAFFTYSDTTTFIPGATTPPPDISGTFASAGFDLTGNGQALGALGYSPYEELPAAVNGLAPPPFNNIPFGQAEAHARALVSGRPPAVQDASVVPSSSAAEAGSMHAELDDGPTAFGVCTVNRLDAAPGVTERSGSSQSRVTTVNGLAASTTTSVLRGVSVAGVLSFDSVTVTSSATADGADGKGTSSVVVEGATVNGIPVQIDKDGVIAAGNRLPIASEPVQDALRQAGIDSVVPGAASEDLSGAKAVTSATGPRISYHDAQHHHFEVALGQALASSTLLPGLPEVLSVQPPPVATIAPAGSSEAPAASAPPASSLATAAPNEAVAPTRPSAPRSVALPAGRTTRNLDRLILSRGHAADRFAVVYGALAIAALLVVFTVAVPNGFSWYRTE